MTQIDLFDSSTAAGSPFSWAPTRAAALSRLQDFLPRAGRSYAATRNFDYGPEQRDNVSLLSPWIRRRLLLEDEVLAATLARHSVAAAEKFIQEVFWRGYFKGWLEHRPVVWQRYRGDVRHLVEQMDRDASLNTRYSEAVTGRTGIACFDAWARELVETGYLHNHTRMWFASIWIFTLRLPWQLGADFFYRHLLDGDPASNTLSWRWVGGLHTKGKTYLARTSNIKKFTNGRFDPSGQLAPSAAPLEERDPGGPLPLAMPDDTPGDRRFSLIVTEDDGTPENLDLPLRPEAILGLTATAARSPLPAGALARDFDQAALADALARAQNQFGATAHPAEGDDWGEILVNFAAASAVDTLVTAYAPVGPVAERLYAAQPALDAAGIRLIRVMRPYDRCVWPHAKKGFFGLKREIPRLLAELDIGN